MPRIPNEGLIPRADRLLIQTFPKVAKRLHGRVDSLDKAAMEAFLKLLPDAVERHQSATTATNDLHESVELAISMLTKSFGSRNAATVEAATQDGPSNMPPGAVETIDCVSDPELPNEPGTGGDGGIQGPDETES